MYPTRSPPPTHKAVTGFIQKQLILFKVKKTSAGVIVCGCLGCSQVIAVLLFGLCHGIDYKDEAATLDFCRKQKIEYTKEGHFILNGTDVTAHLHDDRVTANASQVSSIVEIRHLVNDLMREITKSLSIVCEGRDMTTVVFPNAEVKVYLDATAEVRAKRRFDQGVSDMTLEEIKASIEKRDEMDKNKKEGSLKIAPDALYIDTSNLTIDNVCAIIEKQIS